jgi:molybdopterin-guanine dinucleotide biosynthesis protein A
MNRMLDFAIVILAGGQGRRIGGAKPRRMLGGRSLIDRALEFARALSSDIAISVHDRDQIDDMSVPLLLDTQDAGPIAGLDAALAFAAQQGMDGVLTVPCDAPFLPIDLATRLGEALGANHAVAIPSSGGHLHPTAALWRSSARAALAAYIGLGRSSLTGFAEFAGLVEVPWAEATIDPFFNINSVEDLMTAEAFLRGG